MSGGDVRLLRGDAAALRVDLRVGADRRLDPSNAAMDAHDISRELGPDAGAMKIAAAPALASVLPRGRPRWDRAQAVDLMVRLAEGRKRPCGSPISPAAVSRNGTASWVFACLPGATRTRFAARIWWSHQRAGFTFHVEGHASIFDGATGIFQITDDPTAAAVTPQGANIIATMNGTGDADRSAARDQARDADGPRIARHRARPIRFR
jgi:hypothetical protein